MGAAERLHLEGKDWFREVEAAEYCGVSLSQFREGVRELGIPAKRAFGRKLYSRANLYQAIDSSPEWRNSYRCPRTRPSFRQPRASLPSGAGGVALWCGRQNSRS